MQEPHNPNAALKLAIIGGRMTVRCIGRVWPALRTNHLVNKDEGAHDDQVPK